MKGIWPHLRTRCTPHVVPCLRCCDVLVIWCCGVESLPNILNPNPYSHARYDHDDGDNDEDDFMGCVVFGGHQVSKG